MRSIRRDDSFKVQPNARTCVENKPHQETALIGVIRTHRASENRAVNVVCKLTISTSQSQRVRWLKVCKVCKTFTFDQWHCVSWHKITEVRPCPKRRLRLQLRLDQRVYQCWRIGRRPRSSRSCSRSRRFGHGLRNCLAWLRNYIGVRSANNDNK